jgi:hypothetical protein
VSFDILRHTETRSEGESDLLYKGAFGFVLLPCGRVVMNVFPQGDPALTELAEHPQGFNLVNVWIHAECFRPLFGAQSQSVISGKCVRGGRKDGRGGDPRDCGKRWKLDTFPRTVARGSVVLGATGSDQS